MSRTRMAILNWVVDYVFLWLPVLCVASGVGLQLDAIHQTIRHLHW